MRDNLTFVQPELTGSGLPLASKTRGGLLEENDMRQLPAFDFNCLPPGFIGLPIAS